MAKREGGPPEDRAALVEVPVAATNAVEQVPPGMARVRLRPHAGVAYYLDPQTHLRVTEEPQTVGLALVGEGCRRCGHVIIEEAGND